MWFSDLPFTHTGYGVQTRLFVPHLRAMGHDVALASKYGLHGGLLKWGGCQLYPGGRTEYSQDVLAAHSRHFGADLTVTLCDAQICEPRSYRGMRWVPWFPVDADPLPPDVLGRVRQSFLPVVMSRFGERVARAAGLDVRYVPLGVDTAVYKPGDRAAARERLGWPADRFVVGMVADNKDPFDRKAFAAQIAAFAAFRSRHPDALLYLHTNLGLDGRGIDLVELSAAHGLEVGADVLPADQYLQLLGYPDAKMADVYAGMDVLLACSSHEGFGVPLVEAQACGVPVVTGAWTSTEELCFGGWLVDAADTEPLAHPSRGVVWRPHGRAVAAALEEAYARAGETAWAERALSGAVRYDAALVARTYWPPVLEELAGRLEEPLSPERLLRIPTPTIAGLP